jgi:hypothetical protein
MEDLNTLQGKAEYIRQLADSVIINTLDAERNGCKAFAVRARVRLNRLRILAKKLRQDLNKIANPKVTNET